MSWHYLRELEGESLVDICSDGEPLQPLKSKTIHDVFYCKGKLMDSYLDSLSGMTFAHSMENLGEEKSMSSAVDFPVRTLVQPVKESDLMALDQDFGAKWQGSFAKYNPDTHSLRTHQCSLFEDLTESCVILPRWGLMRDGECWEQRTLEPFICESEFGLSLPTTGANEGKGSSQKRYRNSPHFRGAKTSEALRICETDPIYLNPSFAELIMMWPVGWTDLKPLEMDKSLCVQQQHGKYSVKESND